MDSGRLPSELFRSFQILRTVRSTVFGGCATHSVFGSILSTRDPPETPSSGTATSMLPEEHVHVWFFPEALVTFTSTLSDHGQVQAVGQSGEGQVSGSVGDHRLPWRRVCSLR